MFEYLEFAAVILMLTGAYCLYSNVQDRRRAMDWVGTATKVVTLGSIGAGVIASAINAEHDRRDMDAKLESIRGELVRVRNHIAEASSRCSAAASHDD